MAARGPRDDATIRLALETGASSGLGEGFPRQPPVVPRRLCGPGRVTSAGKVSR